MINSWKCVIFFHFTLAFLSLAFMLALGPLGVLTSSWGGGLGDSSWGGGMDSGGGGTSSFFVVSSSFSGNTVKQSSISF